MPELPAAMQARFEAEFGLSAYDAAALTATRDTATYFVDCVTAAGKNNAKTCANWIVSDLAARLNRHDLAIAASPITAENLASLVTRVADGTINNNTAKAILDEMWLTGQTRSLRPDFVDDAIAKQGLKQVSDASAIEPIIDQVLAANPKSVEEFRAGKEKAFNALVGQIMKATKGKANPQQVNDLLRRKLTGA